METEKYNHTFNVLVIFSTIDNYVDSSEIDIINDFILNTFSVEKPDTQYLMNKLDQFNNLDKDDKYQVLKESGEYLKEICDDDEIHTLLHWVYEVIIADKKIEQEEGRAFKYFSGLLGKNYKDYIEF